MHVHEHPADRRRGDLQIRQAFILTTAGLWVTILLVVWCFTPLTASGVWPLLDLVETSRGRKAPYVEGDIFISVTRTGDLYLEEHRVSVEEVVRGCQKAARLRKDWRGQDYRNEIFLRVDKAAPFRSVRTVLRAAQDANVERVTFLATPRENSLHTVYF